MTENQKKTTKITKNYIKIIDFWRVDVINRMYKQTSNVSDTRKRR